MGIQKKILDMAVEMTAWRQALHQQPELAFEETKTADFVEEKLKSFGIETHRIAGTGIVGVIKAGASDKKIMLRADLDALPIAEETGAAYASRTPGVMHACGHDGHTAMLLGAAKYLNETKDFDGTVYVVFQPAEEAKGGAQKMIADGLFTQFPVDEIYGLHNFPNLPLGVMATVAGPMLSASDEFEVTITGTGGHAARPEDTTDLIGIAAKTIQTLKMLAPRMIPAGEPAMLSICALHTAGIASNVLPEKITFAGSIRSFDPATQKKLKDLLEHTVAYEAKEGGAAARVQYKNNYVALENSKLETDFALAAARATVGDKAVLDVIPRTLGTEDFAFYLMQKKGNFMALGTGRHDGVKSPDLHNPRFDFNDAALPIGAGYWVNMVTMKLPKPSAP